MPALPDRLVHAPVADADESEGDRVEGQQGGEIDGVRFALILQGETYAGFGVTTDADQG